MALDAEELEMSIRGAFPSGYGDAASGAFDQLARAIATAVVAHFQERAEVTVPGAGLVSPSGAVTGTASGRVS